MVYDEELLVKTKPSLTVMIQITPMDLDDEDDEYMLEHIESASQQN